MICFLFVNIGNLQHDLFYEEFNASLNENGKDLNVIVCNFGNILLKRKMFIGFSSQYLIFSFIIDQ